MEWMNKRKKLYLYEILIPFFSECILMKYVRSDYSEWRKYFHKNVLQNIFSNLQKQNFPIFFLAYIIHRQWNSKTGLTIALNLFLKFLIDLVKQNYWYLSQKSISRSSMFSAHCLQHLRHVCCWDYSRRFPTSVFLEMWSNRSELR